MPLFIQRITPIEARRVVESYDEKRDIAAWCDGYATFDKAVSVIFIRQLGREDLWVPVGHWIILNNNGVFVSMSDDRFNELYQSVPDASPSQCETCGGTGETMGMACYGGPPVERMMECPDCKG